MDKLEPGLCHELMIMYPPPLDVPLAASEYAGWAVAGG